jgi:hypothetical protein
LKSASVLVEQEPFADVPSRFKPVLGEALAPLTVRLAISTYTPRSGIRRPNELAIALLDSWLASPPDPEDERGWAELKPELEDITMRLPEPEE